MRQRGDLLRTVCQVVGTSFSVGGPSSLLSAPRLLFRLRLPFAHLPLLWSWGFPKRAGLCLTHFLPHPSGYLMLRKCPKSAEKEGPCA